MKREFIEYYKPYKGVFLFDLLSALALSSISLLFPMLIRSATKEFENGDVEAAVPIIMIMLVLLVFYIISSFFLSHQGHMMGAKIENDMRQELFAHYQSLSLDFYDNHKIGSLMSRINSDLYNIGEFSHHFPEDLVISSVSFVGSLVLMMSINVRIALVPLLMLPFLFGYALKTGLKMKDAYDLNREIMSDFNNSTQESLSGIRVTKSFAQEDYEVEKFHELGHKFLLNKKSFYKTEILFYEGLEGFVLLIPIAILIFGGTGLYYKTIDLPDLLAFFLLLGSFTGPIQKFMHSLMLFQDGTSGFIRFQEYLNIKPSIVEKKDAVDILSVKGEIQFNNVSFSYGEVDRSVLKNINMTVRAGEYIALVGPSGSGKTTLTSLIPRFYDVCSGVIKLDGVDIRELTLKSLRKNIGVVQQDIYLFSGSIFDNISYGNFKSTREAVIEAAKQANAHDFIMDLPEGYDTEVGHRGVKLSGGQRQRISIARVFLKNPPIIILDEATSSLDNESERIIQDAMDALAKGRTTLVVAHRLATIRNAERILVLNQGKIIEEGNHNELLSMEGIYASLYQI